jgi:alkylhydroperoxidase/carboxymuconolactone decarboxylase family protein YurZ
MSLDHGDLDLASAEVILSLANSGVVGRIRASLRDQQEKLTLGLVRQRFLQVLQRKADRLRPMEGGPYRGSLMSYVRDLERKLAFQVAINKLNCESQNKEIQEVWKREERLKKRLREWTLISVLLALGWAATIVILGMKWILDSP